MKNPALVVALVVGSLLPLPSLATTPPPKPAQQFVVLDGLDIVGRTRTPSGLIADVRPRARFGRLYRPVIKSFLPALHASRGQLPR